MTTRVWRNVSVHFGLVAFLASALFGCSPSAPVRPERLILDPHASGNEQTGMYGESLAKPFRVIAEGPVQPGMLGGKGSRGVSRDVIVRFTVVDTNSGAVFAENGEMVYETTTNTGGHASATLRLGEKPGDVMVLAQMPNYPEVHPVWFRATNGVERIGADLEGPTGGTIESFGVRLQDPDGTPAAGVEVYFHADGNPQGGSVRDERLLTDEQGLAVTSWKLGSKVSQYFVSVEIRDARPATPAERRFSARAVRFTAMATDKREMVLVLIGGLAVFIFGMKQMSEGLQRAADRRLKRVLHFMTQNRFMAAGAGVLITAMVQSSSATTVMTVGFVNAGLMTLKQSIGVVFGANIGTTVTAQIIAFKLDALAYPAIAVGFLMMSLANRQQLKSVGQSILGFGFLFLGMTTMSGMLKPLQNSPEFVSLFQLFDCTPIDGGGIPATRALLCILIGTATTVLVQSSSATVGLVLALSSQGLIGFYTAVPLVLGDNIGTTITAILASIGTNRVAKRTAAAHTLFNLIGAGYMYILLFLPWWHGQPVFLGFVDYITPGDVFTDNPENLMRHVANAHSAFNLINVILFLPFVGVMAKICEFIIPITDRDKDSVLQYLEPKLLQTPSIALAQSVNEVGYMVRKGQNSVNESCDLFCDPRDGLAASILAREDLIDRLQQEITAYLVDLSRTSLDPKEAALIPALVHAVNDAERLGDHAEQQLELQRLLQETNQTLPPEGIEAIRKFRKGLNRMFECIYKTLEKGDEEAAMSAQRIYGELNALVKKCTDQHVNRLEAGDRGIQAGVIYLDALAHLERVGNHLVNIAERAVKVAQVMRE